MAKETEKDLVELFIPQSRKKDAPTSTFIGLNGKNYIIKHGVKVKVPKGVKEIYDNSEQAKDDEYEAVTKVTEKMPAE